MIDMRGLVTIGAMVIAIYAVFGQPMGTQRGRQVSVGPNTILMVSTAPQTRALLLPAAYIPAADGQGRMRRSVP